MRHLLKKMGRVVANGAAAPFFAYFAVEAWVLGPDAAFEDASQALSLLPGTLGVYIRSAFYARTLANCSRTCVISFGTLFSDRRAEIGENVYIGPNCDIGYAILESDVLLGSGVHILSGKRQHYIDDVTRPIRLQGGALRCVRIGAGTWIGNNATVMADIGCHSVVGAGSVVTREMDNYLIVAGNPATPIRRRLDPPAVMDRRSPETVERNG